MFAIDGQHRVAGIQIAYQEEKTKLESARVLTDDKFPIIFVAHIDDEGGRKRTRKLFSDINKNAKKVEEGDTIKIDEEDLAAITTRRIYANYFKFEGLIALTETAKLDNADKTNFTNLLGLNTVSKELKRLHRKQKGTYAWDEVNVLSLYTISELFWDTVIDNLDEYKHYFVDKTLTIVEAREQNKYLLFRLIGLKILSKLYVHFLKKYGGSTTEFINKVHALSFTAPDTIFNGLLWNNGRIEFKHTTLAYNIALYVMNEFSGDTIDLLKSYKDAIKNDSAVLPDVIV